MKNKKIALTGGIGSGKSTALNILKSAGYKTLSSDDIVSDLYNTRKVKKLLKTLFPNAVSGFINLKIDRKKISQIVFNDTAMHKKLTDTITPLVLEEIHRRVKSLTESVFVEVPLLFECNYQNEFDAVMVITRDKNARIDSVKRRSNLTEEEIISRMAKQTDYDSFDLTPYFCIANDSDELSLKEKVLTTAKKIVE
jgi:dephospho-CoA kinase